ncbi:RNA polymerase sigma factor SigJ [Actinomadura harenae]|uniref:Sigma-70 family RNA polymerase sigma factor n=1 Tax=Actinomadura harenae TaxID=2483351 RepID=A0A3M2LNY7_9ACTN|nr:RNA polymerase sigma factor SigJ [Actinomadura harenae]RMI39181.1 sigma-70 family RNA polymerase sigma factor [Actinomadura harenae]
MDTRHEPDTTPPDTTPTAPDAGAPGDGLDALMSERRHLISLAYRLLGSLADAEDVVQETYTRWYAQPRERQDAIGNPAAWLTRVAGRICLDVLGSARARRESYVGAWLPEPVPGRIDGRPGEGGGGAVADPAERVTLDESITMAFLVVLESTTPAERVAFVLHDVFRYPFAEVAEIVGRTPAACRQLAVSARRRLDAARTSAAPSAQSARVVRDLKRAWETKDIGALVAVLAPDAVAVGDGGGVVSALLEPVEGAEAIARHLVRVLDLAPGMEVLERTVNARPGLVVRHEGAIAAVFTFGFEDGRVRHLWGVRNPEKLRPWTAD